MDVLVHWRLVYSGGSPGPWMPGEPPDFTADAVERIERDEFVPAAQLRGAVSAERERIIARLVEMAGVLDQDSIAGTAETLRRAAAVLSVEGGQSS